MKRIFLYLMTLMYVGMGVMHITKPDSYNSFMPSWLPYKTFMIYLSGSIEIILAVLILPVKTRQMSSIIIILMLFVFLVAIHIPQSIEFYKTSHPNFIASLIRLPIQFVFIYWTWIYARPNNRERR